MVVAFECPCSGPRYFPIPALEEILPHWMPDDVPDTLACLLFSCAVKTILMIAAKHVLEHLSSNFATIEPQHKKWYVLTHLTKALMLLIVVLNYNNNFSEMYSDNFPRLLKRGSAIFVANNIVALYMLEKISHSTVIHHLAAVLLFLGFLLHDLEAKGWTGTLGVAKISSFYGLIVSNTFSVHAYLGLRVIYPKAAWLRGFVRVTLCVDLGCFVANWSVHCVWIASLVSSSQVSLSTFLYMILLVAAVYDDIVLLKWLKKECKRN